MDDPVHVMAANYLVRDSGAAADSIEIVRARQVGDRVIVMALWVDTRAGRARRGSVEMLMEDGALRTTDGWSANTDHDGVAILIYDAAFSGPLVVEAVDDEGTVVGSAPL